MFIKLIIGDFSQDGHEKTYEPIIDANISFLMKLEKRIKKDVKLLGLIFVKSFAYHTKIQVFQ